MEDYRNQIEEIDLIGMFFYVLKKWRSILIWGIIGLVIGCGFSFFKMKQMDPKNLDSYFATLEAADKINIDNITIYKDYKALYDGVLERGEKSVVLNMDPNKTFSTSLTYFYSSDDNTTVEAFFNSFFDTGDYQMLIETSGLNCEVGDIREMVSLGYSKTFVSNLIVDSAYLEEEQTGKLGVSVIAPSEEVLNALVDQLKLMISQGNRELETQVNGFKSELLSEVSDFGYSSSVASRQNSFVEERISYLKNLTTYKDKLSDDEKLYVAYYFPDGNTELVTGFSKKWPVIFAVALALVVAIIYAFAFIGNGKMNSESDLNPVKNMFVIAYLDGKRKKGLDKVLDTWSLGSKVKSSSQDTVLKYISSLSCEKIGIFLDNDDESERTLAKLILEKCKEKIELFGTVGSEIEKRADIAETDELIALVHLGNTKKADFFRVLDVCKQLGREVMNVIIIR